MLPNYSAYPAAGSPCCRPFQACIRKNAASSVRRRRVCAACIRVVSWFICDELIWCMETYLRLGVMGWKSAFHGQVWSISINYVLRRNIIRPQTKWQVNW